MLKIDRRAFVAACAGSLVVGPGAFAQHAVNVEELQAPGQLGEMTLGSTDAPVTVVEYASMSCPHCAHFHRTTFPEFKEKYIDSGKVRFIFREFPLNAPAFAASMVARCAPADRYFDVVGTYFDKQDSWLSAQNLRASILEVAQEFGFTEQTFDACVRNQALFTGLEGVKSRGVAFGVQATPTFFIGGKKLEGALTLEQFDKELQPLL